MEIHVFKIYDTKKASIIHVMVLYIILACVMVEYSSAQQEKENIFLWSVRYDYDQNAIKQIYGEPDIWVQQLLQGGGFNPRELTGQKALEFGTLAMHYEKGLVFWFDLLSGQIEYGDALYNSSGLVHVVTHEQAPKVVDAMTVDWINNDVYWSVFDPPRNSSVIYKAAILDPTNSKQVVISENINRISGLQIVPQRGYLFFSDSIRKRIERSDLSGGNRVSFPLEEIPSSMAIDFEHERIFWLGHAPIEQYGVIKSFFWDGTEKRSLVTRRDLLARVKMDVYKNIIFLTIKDETGFELINRDTGVSILDAKLRNPGAAHDLKMFARENQPMHVKETPTTPAEFTEARTTLPVKQWAPVTSEAATTKSVTDDGDGDGYGGGVPPSLAPPSGKAALPTEGVIAIGVILSLTVISVSIIVAVYLVVRLKHQREPKPGETSGMVPNKHNQHQSGRVSSGIYEEIDESKLSYGGVVNKNKSTHGLKSNDSTHYEAYYKPATSKEEGKDNTAYGSIQNTEGNSPDYLELLSENPPEGHHQPADIYLHTRPLPDLVQSQDD